MDEAMNVTKRAGLFDKRLDRGAGGHIDSRGCYLEAGFTQCLCCSVGILLAQISQHQVLARTDPPGDSLADRSGSNNNNYLCHDISFGFGCWDVCQPSLMPMLQRT